MEEYYPSEIARLVLGYLKEVGCHHAWKTFVQESFELREYYNLYKQGKVYTTNVNEKSLIHILSEYCSFKSKACKRYRQIKCPNNTFQNNGVDETSSEVTKNTKVVNQMVQTSFSTPVCQTSNKTECVGKRMPNDDASIDEMSCSISEPICVFNKNCVIMDNTHPKFVMTINVKLCDTSEQTDLNFNCKHQNMSSKSIQTENFCLCSPSLSKSSQETLQINAKQINNSCSVSDINEINVHNLSSHELSQLAGYSEQSVHDSELDDFCDNVGKSLSRSKNKSLSDISNCGKYIESETVLSDEMSQSLVLEKLKDKAICREERLSKIASNSPVSNYTHQTVTDTVDTLENMDVADENATKALPTEDTAFQKNSKVRETVPVNVANPVLPSPITDVTSINNLNESNNEKVVIALSKKGKPIEHLTTSSPKHNKSTMPEIQTPFKKSLDESSLRNVTCYSSAVQYMHMGLNNHSVSISPSSRSQSCPITPKSRKISSPYTQSEKPKSMEYFYRKAFPNKKSDLPISPLSFSNSSCTADAFSAKRQLLGDGSSSQLTNLLNIKNTDKTRAVISGNNEDPAGNVCAKECNNENFDENETGENCNIQEQLSKYNEKLFIDKGEQEISGSVTGVYKNDKVKEREAFLSDILGRERKISESLYSDTCSTVVDCSDLEIMTPEKDNHWLNKSLFSKEQSPILSKNKKFRTLSSSLDVTPSSSPEKEKNLASESACSSKLFPEKSLDKSSHTVVACNSNTMQDIHMENLIEDCTIQKSVIDSEKVQQCMKSNSNTKITTDKSPLLIEPEASRVAEEYKSLSELIADNQKFNLLLSKIRAFSLLDNILDRLNDK